MLKHLMTFCCFSISLFAKAQIVDFIIQNSSNVYCNPSTIQFKQNCTGTPTGFLWDFGNNAQAFGSDVQTTYTSAGVFTVTLTAIYDQSSISISKTITINPAVTVSIGFDRNYICTPGAINFSGISTGNIADYSWDFGDSSGKINVPSKDIAHSFTSFGNYPITLKVTDVSGCTGQATSTVKVARPSIAANSTPTRGCIPADVNFIANVNVPVNDFVTNYSWDFDDGIPVFSTNLNSISHQYATVGLHLPSVSITTNDGCSNKLIFSAIAFGTPPSNPVAYAKKPVLCGSETSIFVATATNATSYLWNFGDGTSLTVTDTIAQHKYATLGPKIAKVTPLFNGCAGPQLSVNINVVGVIAKYTFKNTCADRKTYIFTNTSQGRLTGKLWDFGDNSSTVTTTNASHPFPASGQFTTTLTVDDAVSGCSDSYSLPIYTAQPILTNLDSLLCRYDSTNFSIQNSYTNSAASYTWNVVGSKVGPGKTSSITVKANTHGNFNNFVIINYGSQSCPDTVQLDHLISVAGPDLTFTAPASQCFNTLFGVTNTSTPFIQKDSVILWYWNFGNTAVNDTIYQPIPFQYNFTGSFKVKLVGVDINGCRDSLSKNTVVSPLPFLQVVPAIDTMCLGQPVTLKVFTNGSILWSPANDISCATCDSVVANPTVTTRYYITATSTSNCTVQDSLLVKVYNPFTVIAPTNIFYVCENGQVQLDINPKVYMVTWSPVTGLSNSNTYNPIASPSQSTTYTATLTDSVGCFTASTSIDVILKALPTVDLGPDKIVPFGTTYTITPEYSSNIVKYAWTPSTLLSCNACAIPTGVALQKETYTVKVTSDSGCVASDSIIVFVECKNANVLMPKAFTPNNDNLNDFYYPITRGIKSITRFAIFDRQGQLVYEARNFAPNSKSFAWDGKFKGQNQPFAAYVFILEALCDLGETITKSGTFLLLK